MSASNQGFYVSSSGDIPSPFEDLPSLSFAKVSPAEFGEQAHGGLYVITYEVMSTELEDLNAVFENVLTENNVLIVTPPFPNDLDQLAINDQKFTLDSNFDDDRLVVHQPLQRFVGKEHLEIVSKGIFRDTSIPVLARNSAGQPVILDYRTSNVSGSVLFTAVELTRRSLRASRNDQTVLLEGFANLLQSRRQSSSGDEDTAQQDETDDDDKVTLSSETKDKVLLSVAVQGTRGEGINLSSAGNVLPASIGLALSDEELARTRDWLEEMNCINEKDLADQDRIEELIEQRNLNGFYRRLTS